MLTAGLLSPFGRPGEVVRMIVAESLALVYDARIMAEYAHVLKRPKFSLNPEHIKALLDQIKAEGAIAASNPLVVRLPDRDTKPSSKLRLPDMPTVHHRELEPLSGGGTTGHEGSRPR